MVWTMVGLLVGGLTSCQQGALPSHPGPTWTLVNQES